MKTPMRPRVPTASHRVPDAACGHRVPASPASIWDAVTRGHTRHEKRSTASRVPTRIPLCSGSSWRRPVTIDYAAIALALAKASGCTFEPVVTAGTTLADGVHHVRLGHDAWCPLLVRAERRN